MLEHFTDRAERGEPKRRFQRGFFAQRARIIGHLLGGRGRILEWGCGSGQLLEVLEATDRVGWDFCPAMIWRAKQNQGNIRFELSDILLPEPSGEKPFDAIIMDYLVPYLPDVQLAFENALKQASAEIRLIVTSLNAIYAPFLGCLHRLGLSEPLSEMNWLSRADLRNLLELAGWEVVTERPEQLLPCGDYLVIQDADLTAPPEDLPKFYQGLYQGDAEFANGSRLVYPMEKRAMRFLNLIGNKFFAEALTLVLGQRIKDSLCGTKMVRRGDYERLIRLVRAKMGDFDPFGDFNLLFGASLYQLKIRDIPVRYAERSYGDPNISRFRHGVILFQMTWKGLLSLYLFPLRGRKCQSS